MVVHLAQHFGHFGVVLVGGGKHGGQIPDDDSAPLPALASCSESAPFWVNVHREDGPVICNLVR